MKIIECPRDAMQGLPEFISTDKKVEYINALLEVGFDTIDFGSFVSPKAIPQLRDTAEVLGRLNLEGSRSKLLAIVANVRGAQEAATHEAISYLGFPLSISETFQQRNTNKSIAQALEQLQEIQNICQTEGKELVVYISMGFGNPFGDPYSPEVVEEYVEKMHALGVRIVSLADTIGAAEPEAIKALFESQLPKWPNVELGAHLHASPKAVKAKVAAAYKAGCRRIDGALAGFGGCPFAEDELVGNVATEQMIDYLAEQGEKLGLNEAALQRAMLKVSAVFPAY